MFSDGRPGVGRFRPAGAQVVDGEIHGFRQGGAFALGQQLNDRREFQQGADGAAVEGRQHDVADERILEGHHQGDFVAALLHMHAQELGIGDALHQRGQIQVAVLAAEFT